MGSEQVARRAGRLNPPGRFMPPAETGRRGVLGATQLLRSLKWEMPRRRLSPTAAGGPDAGGGAPRFPFAPRTATIEPS